MKSKLILEGDRKMKKVISIICAISVFSLSLFSNSFFVNATTTDMFMGYYSGTYDNSNPMEFEIYNIDTIHNTFTGHVKITTDLANADEDITGKVDIREDYFICSFGFKQWIYDTTFSITVYPKTGIAEGYGGGGLFINGNIYLIGTRDPFYNEQSNYSENDMKMCMALSF